ncbi:Protein of unknown function [Bacillus mycoides]|nr:Protein of unknown function [Bacillus mycoides]
MKFWTDFKILICWAWGTALLPSN